MEGRQTPPPEGTTQFGISPVERQDRCAQRTYVNNLAALVCERFRHVEWRTRPEFDLASIADRSERNSLRYWAAGGIALISSYSLTGRRRPTPEVHKLTGREHPKIAQAGSRLHYATTLSASRARESSAVAD